MNEIREYRPKRQKSGPRRTWRSALTGITIPLDPQKLQDDLDGYELKTLALLIDDMNADLQKLRCNRSALLRSMNAAGASSKQIAAQVARIDLDRAPMIKAQQIMNRVIQLKKSAVPWGKLFVEVARRRLDPEVFKLINDETSKLRDQLLEERGIH